MLVSGLGQTKCTDRNGQDPLICAAPPVAQVGDGQSARLWPQALDGADPLSRQWERRDRQQHRRTRDPHISIGHKNWLFAGSTAGGERAAAIYSVIETCKLNGVEPRGYIADVISKMADAWPASRWDELMPRDWTAEQPPVSMAA